MRRRCVFLPFFPHRCSLPYGGEADDWQGNAQIRDFLYDRIATMEGYEGGGEEAKIKHDEYAFPPSSPPVLLLVLTL
jgi:hypothetical protein